MVDALAETRRVLRPGGIMFDLRPYAAPWRLEVLHHKRKWSVGFLDGTLKASDDLACEAALDVALNHTWFNAGPTDLFDYSYYLSSPANLPEAIAYHWPNAVSPPTPFVIREMNRVWSLADQNAELCIRRPLRLTTYHRLD